MHNMGRQGCASTAGKYQGHRVTPETILEEFDATTESVTLMLTVPLIPLPILYESLNAYATLLHIVIRIDL
jgi:hypothetical protein